MRETVGCGAVDDEECGAGADAVVDEIAAGERGEGGGCELRGGCHCVYVYVFVSGFEMRK